MSAWAPTVGQRVRLNDNGYESLHLKSAQEFRDSQELIVTYVENIGYAEEPIWSMGVDKESIGKFMLDSTMFDPI